MKSETIQIPSFTIHSPAGKLLLQTPAFGLTRGKTIAVTGPSGAGKSLFLKTLFGWSGKRIRPVLSPKQGAFLMIQDPSQGLTPGLTLGDHFREVATGCNWRNRASNHLADLGLQGTDLFQRRPHSFSGGERQRIMLALILMRDPNLLVCDEPAASLDTTNEERLWQLLERMKGEMTLIFVTHQLQLIERFATEVILLEAGGFGFRGAKELFFSDIRSPSQKRLVEIYRGSRPAKREETGTPAKRPPLLETRSLGLKIGSHRVFRNISWQIEAGSWWWLVGPSGAGKTSLARTMAGLVPSSEGDILLGGEPLQVSLKQRTVPARRAIQYLFQHGTRALNPALSVARQLARVFRGKPELLATWLHELHLDEVNLNKPPRAFSLGEVQRLNLIRALAAGPSLLICDELLTSLDLALQHSLIRFLDRYRERHGTAILVISHDALLRQWQPGNIMTIPFKKVDR